MIDVPVLVDSVLAGPAFQLAVSVSSWRGGTLLAADIPVPAASEESDRSLRVPERVTFSIPRYDGGMSWAPNTDVDHPLASNGQRLAVKLGVRVAGSEPEFFGRGWFLITDAEADGDIVSVTAVGLLQLVDEARLVAPYQPTGTLGSTLRGLIEPGITVDLTGAPADRSVPTGINYDEDRLGAVLELADAWAAEAVITEGGYLAVTPAATPTVAVATITDSGSAATIVQTTGSSSRDGGYNVVVARGTGADGAQVQGQAYDNTSTHAYGTAWSPYPVPYFFSSPLLTTNDQCEAAARTVMARLKRAAGQEFTIECVPNPTLQLGDPVQLVSVREDFTGLVTVERLTLPYTASGDARMTVVVRAVVP